mgnify:CR=1 FL=1
MKTLHSIILAFAAFSLSIISLCGCSITTKTSEEKAAEEQRIEAGVLNALQSRRYRITVDTMIPRRGGTQHLTTQYSITVDGDDFVSYLPYFGVAYDVPYGGGKVLNFESKTDSYTRSKTRKGEERIVIITDNGEDVLKMNDSQLRKLRGGSAQTTVRINDESALYTDTETREQPAFLR